MQYLMREPSPYVRVDVPTRDELRYVVVERQRAERREEVDADDTGPVLLETHVAASDDSRGRR